MTDRGTSLQWRRLRAVGGEGDHLTIASTEIEVAGPAGALRLAVGRDGSAMLLIPLGFGDPPIDIAPGRSLELRETVMRLRGVPVRFAELGCRDARLEAVFEELVDAIVRRIGDGDPPASAVQTTIGEFRDLLAGTAFASPSIGRNIGILAELRKLNALLEFSPRAWMAWTGPLAGRHDFRAGTIALECKATLRTAGPRITIASIDQLDPPSGGQLFLDLQVFEIDIAGAWSVASEARRACALASDTAEILRRLHAVNCDPEDAGWDARFSVMNEAVYAIEGDFPRLTTADLMDGRLPPGVVGLTYEIDPGSATAAPLGDAAVRQVLESIAHAP